MAVEYLEIRNKTMRNQKHIDQGFRTYAVYGQKTVAGEPASNRRNSIKKGHLRLFAAGGLDVEAAGIEPASRDISMAASTCIVDYLIFDRETPIDRLSAGLARNLFNRRRARHDRRRSEFGDRLSGLFG